MSSVIPSHSGTCSTGCTPQATGGGSRCDTRIPASTGCCTGSIQPAAHGSSMPAAAAIPLGTVNVHSMLSPEGKAARLALLEHLINTGRPFDSASESLGVHDAFLPELEAQHVFARTSSRQIGFAYPVSAIPTTHRVLLADGRSFFAMCAVDAMGSHFALHQDITIHSRCAQSGSPIQVSIKNGMLDALSPAETHAIHVDLTKFTNWAASC